MIEECVKDPLVHRTVTDSWGRSMLRADPEKARVFRTMIDWMDRR